MGSTAKLVPKALTRVAAHVRHVAPRSLVEATPAPNPDHDIQRLASMEPGPLQVLT
jgi:hypothetical protein